jgi:hypothetical protein
MNLRVAGATGALALVALLGACGTSKPAVSAPASTDTASTDQTTTTAAGNSAYRDCLSQHGVTLPSFRPPASTPPASTPPDSTPPDSTPPDSGPRGSFPGGPNGSLDPATQAAMQACASLRPQGNGNGFGNRAANSQAFQAYYSCLKDNGVDVPDTTATNGPPPSIDRSSPAFAAANAKCQVLLPQRGGNGSTTTTTTPG